ncbi:type II secretion system protein GspM [Comamonas endophytica]|uniref:Type II secretion system protein M n=1 Tax=Comamonas endophytica TaxID=2949090 RepID=A0ABY6GDJ9_9BURK|nr:MULTISPECIES: type II secretion system protein GspM [unclassified Acidovorax]MCD2512883.1 type II secretion system protein M [Acidovorax sp. D4N7]UYG52770.1 type II secretion system protein M [Acidovorax sp. 5MLIR]
MNTPRKVRLDALRARWSALAPRERQALALAAGTVGLALLWWVLLAPALQTLRAAPAQHALLDQQLQRMQRLEAEALRLQADLPPPAIESPNALPAPRPDLQRALQESVTAQLGAGARLVLQGERAQLTLKSVPAPALAAWLGQARQNLRVGTLEMRLTAAAGVAPGANDQQWDGSLVLGLPPAEAAP